MLPFFMGQKKMGQEEETSSNISPQVPSAYEIDFYVINHGSIYTFHPKNQFAKNYWKKNVSGKSNMGYNVDRYLADSLIQGMMINGVKLRLYNEDSDKPIKLSESPIVGN